MEKYYFLVLSNPVEGREEEYNAWYSDIHIIDALKVPGIKAARRFHLSKVQRRDPPYLWNYMTLYEIETNDLAETMRILNERSGSAVMPVSDAFDPKHIALVFEAITPRLESTDVA